jgi:hypothetical protein
MSWILVSGAVLCGWAMLRTMGGERERRVFEQRAAAVPPPPPAPAGPPAAQKPPASKWASRPAA